MGRNRIVNSKFSLPVSTGDQHTPAANTAAVVTYAAQSTNISHVITGFRASVSAGAPLDTLPSVKVEDGSGNVVFQQYMTKCVVSEISSANNIQGPQGPQADLGSADIGRTMYEIDIVFPQPKKGTGGRAMIVTVPASGLYSLNMLSVYGHWTEAA